MPLIWGIDLGGTKIEAALIDRSQPEKPICRRRLPTEGDLGYDHIIAQIGRVCEIICAETGEKLPARIGIGTPGVTDPRSGKLKNSNTQCLNGRTLRDDLSAALGVEFVAANDANCLALAEAQFGSARGYATVFGVILGTGVGGGVVVNGHILEGCHGIAGEWGNITVDRDGPPSAYGYGARGTVESLIAGPALERHYAARAGQKLGLKEIAARAKAASDEHAVETIEFLTDQFARHIAMVIDILDPHAIVLGGGVGNIDALYTEATREKIISNIFNPEFNAALLKPTLGDSGGVFGAAMLVA